MKIKFSIVLLLLLLLALTQLFVIQSLSASYNKDSLDDSPLRLPNDLKSLGLHTNSSSHYNYSKVDLAIAIKKRNQPPRIFTLVKKLFFKYPANHLDVHAYATRHQSPSSHDSRVYIEMEVLSLGTLHEHTTTETNLLNISMHLTFTRGNPEHMAKYYSDFYTDFLEGVYDPLSGEMHLTGCRKVSNSNIGTGVEDHGLDCLVEVKVQYPSETLRWLKNPSIEVTITSQRSEDDDMLHFEPLVLKTHKVPFDKHPENAAFRELFEEVLRFLISLATVGIILSQLRYMNAHEEFAPYVSLVMLSVLITGYAAELVSNTEIFFESKESSWLRKWPYESDKLLMESIESPTRLMVLAALLITAWMYQKVSEAKSRTNGYGSDEPKRVPPGKDALKRHLKTLLIGFCIACLGISLTELVLGKGLKLMDAFVLAGVVMRDLRMLVLVSKDLFLLPQIFENSVWKKQVKALRKTYYVGLTLLWLVVDFYDYIRDPVLDPFYDDGVMIKQVDSYFFSIVGVIGAPILMVTLASVVHIQQSSNYLKPRSG